MGNVSKKLGDNRKMTKIYCAGPLFNNKEKEEMQEIANILESNGYEVFLPQRDGFKFSSLFPTFLNLGIPEYVARRTLNKAIFILDVFQILDSDGFVININGRVPDEGAAVEAGIAWSSGKKIVIYKNDARTLLNGNDSPLLLGLSDFKIVSKIEDIPKTFDNLFVTDNRDTSLYERGEQLTSLAKEKITNILTCRKLIELENLNV